MKKVKYLAIALAVSLSMAMLACSQPMGYVSDNDEAAQTVIALLASPPAVTSVTGTAFDTDTTDHYVNMPATVNAGDLLIVLFTNDGSATVTTPDGCSLLASDASGSAVRLSAYYRIAAGTEGGTTVNLVTSAAEQAAAQVYGITDWNGTTPPEISTAAGTSPAPNPASLTPAAWDMADTLWLAVGGQDRGHEPGTTTYPTSYAGGIGTLSSDVLGNCRTLSAHRVHATASENPGAFTIPVSEEWVAFTIAVRSALRDLTISSTAGGSVTTPGEGVFTYDGGTVVDLVATPDAGYRFVNWTGNVSAVEDVYGAETTITVNDDCAVTANFVALYDLTISIFSTGGGSVIEPGEGVFTYDEGTVVDLVVIPDAGYRFVEWTGDVGTIADVHDASTTITMNGNYAVRANFVPIYDLTISSTEGGSVTEPGEGVFTYDEGTVVDLVAIPDAGYRFVEWIGDVGTIADVHDASTTITMNGNYAVTTKFVAIYDLTISSTEGGSATEPGEGVFTYDEGTVVDLVATPDGGYRFVEWTGDVGAIADVYDATTTITMNGDYAITANFIKQYDLTTSSTDGGSVTEPGEGMFTYDEGTVVDLVATPDAGYRFVNWTGDVSAVANVTAGRTTIRMNGDYSVSANFVRQCTLTNTSTAGGSITAPGEGIFTYDAGTVVNLVATPASRYRFVNWTGNVGTINSTNAASTTITMRGNYSITASFEATAPWVPPIIQYGLIVFSGPGGSVTSPGVGIFAYDAGTVVNLVATSANGYRFVSWSGSVGTIANVYAASTTITMNSNYSITANFVAIYDLSISSTEGVSVVQPGEGVFSYDEGTVVDLVAEAEQDYRFVEWTGDVGTIADVYAAETTITMKGDYSITANFERIPPSKVYPTVTTRVAADITTNSATLGMSYTVGDFSLVEVRFAYRKSTDSTWSYTVWVPKTAGGTHAEVLTGLDFNTAYDFKSQLKYDGTVIGGTTLQFTTDTPSPSGSGGCFIATAAYGTPSAKQIDLLREFRDVVLLKSTVGSQFVALYYRVSHPIADFVAGNELLTTLVRELLVDPIVWVVQATEDTQRN